ncbi:hypothetical protein [Paramicrobacterium agarici]|uniref:Lipoprotein n=1 Tax=Paramicrobacterium agarici TaxID=630514 RepID=A0A2A9DUM4_9MICO|nr:hypothetical protein [Microbacterium agarici]PFG30388.1 hypothetical protein ATJ78_1317 [Microbacterium agarici]
MRFSRLRRAVATLACATAVVAGATACTPAEPEKTPTPTKTAIFASEDEALQAAVDVYQQYSAAYDEALSSAEPDYSAVSKYATERFISELVAADEEVANGSMVEGTSSFDTVSLVDFDHRSDPVKVDIKLCRDVSKQAIVDANGKDITPDERLERFPFEVLLVWDDANSTLKVDDLGSWQGENFCA